MAVLAGEFVCPHCAARLRIQQRGLQSTTLDCPECARELLLERSFDGELSVSVPAQNKSLSSSELTVLRKKPSRFTAAIWLTGGGVLLLLAGVFLWPRTSSQTSSGLNAESADNPIPAANVPAKAETKLAAKPAAAVLPAAPGSTATAEEHPFEQNLRLLGERVTNFRLENGQFPAALREPGQGEPSTRFSWLASLDPALEADAALLPQWNLAWNDPLNDRFVRRKRTDLLNPAIEQQASAERYPAGHVVGIAGVGRDGPTLPPTHSRAGIFGWNRSTRAEQVKDGLSNTMLAAGVTNKLASWADGSASIRPLVNEPYVNGIDGFGTGQKEGMSVLMADGSVRFLSHKTSATIIRRMAAMADGLPLDEKIPGEPGETRIAAQPEPIETPPVEAAFESPVTMSQEATPDSAEKNDPPLAAPTMPSAEKPTEPADPPAPAIDFKKLLAETVLVYQLTTAAPLEEVLAELEAMFGARIEFDGQQIPVDHPDRRLPVSLNGKNISYGDLLQNALETTPFEYHIQENKLVIVRKGVP